MSELFQTTQQNVSRHAKNIFEDGELVEYSVVKESLTVQIEGKREVQRALQPYFAEKRRTDFPVCWAKRITGWKTRAPMKGLSSVARRAKGEILEGIGV